MKPCPDHVREFLVDSPRGTEIEADLFDVRCGKCGHSRFTLSKSNLQSVRVECESCKNSQVIYDLAQYPAASKVSGDETFSTLPDLGNAAFRVYISYEYGEFDEDDEFNCNDITWCDIYVDIDGELKRVFTDETA